MTATIDRREFIAAGVALAAGAAPRFAGAGTVVVFQGDSITAAGRDRAVPEPNDARGLGTGYPALVAAAVRGAHAARDVQFYNRGIGADKVPDLAARWDADALALAPDILSILVGVNDFWHTLLHGYTGTLRDYEDAYAALLARTRSALPAVRLLILEPFALAGTAVDGAWFPEFHRRRAATARVARGANAVFVPLQAVFDELLSQGPAESWTVDGVHPTPAGHRVIAQQWRRAAGL